MARLMFGTDPEVFRAVIMTHHAAEPESRWAAERVERTETYYAGPFAGKAQATAAITKAKKDAAYANRHWGRGKTVTGYVERAPLNWERIE
ncbi:hypothetical protein [Micromonospora sp. KC213]|uniref:hypothetical protein n=1 Tax=Micromonospora sp. KC213 TaxID=2530378 RepID=UPI00104593B8|nr:hypothetical protein [Micromonospora sp. KC213]TDC29971.1 hypothetical protein E1166_29380 [Micromonospora sp. KC213]